MKFLFSLPYNNCLFKEKKRQENKRMKYWMNRRGIWKMCKAERRYMQTKRGEMYPWLGLFESSTLLAAIISEEAYWFANCISTSNENNKKPFLNSWSWLHRPNCQNVLWKPYIKENHLNLSPLFMSIVCLGLLWPITVYPPSYLFCQWGSEKSPPHMLKLHKANIPPSFPK